MEWYRKKSWSEKDKEEFFNRLKRARKYNRAQYLKIQAIELIETNNLKLLDIAESLLNKMLNEYSEEKSQISSALNSLGDIYLKQNEIEKAIEFYRKSIDFEKNFPNVKTQSYLEYSELIIKNNKLEEFDFVETIILERFDDIIFPIEKYKTASILSIVYEKKGLKESSTKYAEIAEQNANKETSGLRYHQHLGLVNKRINWLDRLVKRK
ncbi:hypothetical protein F7018_07995 [Tenacibaculum aiptasiae]|uniref:Tetratricopeptide repeat protein n=1 Tax=Tenacibaculum aiptasiae TaxID=426481 RepID=A0A7J5ALS8_9FLAO|nr:tetratricopeptide repeat protein [Tenacibaculum aiptasiae]KAB1158551.1 hypothetical protein F7018_07995 [Tenacibaculum aiptasiae]